MQIRCIVSLSIRAEIHEPTGIPVLHFTLFRREYRRSHEHFQHKTDVVNYLFSSNTLAGRYEQCNLRSEFWEKTQV
jgi:hypothetical protein